MDPQIKWIVPLSAAADCPEEWIGSKAAKLGHALSAGIKVPNGFCVTTHAYEAFLSESGLAKYVAMELGRKPLENMRWEEIWDTALRIRSEFLRAKVPERVSEAIRQAVAEMTSGAVAVRSSALGEDSAGFSFAGLHESVVGVIGPEAVLQAVRCVWASLWSDAALLYRSELSLDPMQSRMAVLVQELVVEDRSGVAFGRDPRNLESDHSIIEAVPGQCALLVDGDVDPDRWIVSRDSGEVVQWRHGVRDDPTPAPLLDPNDLDSVVNLLGHIETLFGWAPDMEWTGRSPRLTLLQARPITTIDSNEDDQRAWYLSLRPGAKRLQELAQRVSEELIPKLENEGKRFAAENLSGYDDRQLAEAIEHRLATLRKWKEIYWDEFIPFAHGVRQLARYYNDAVQPVDPYEFVGLLKRQELLASKRNRAMASLASKLRNHQELKDLLTTLIRPKDPPLQTDWTKTLDPLQEVSGGREFLEELQQLMRDFMDVTVGSHRMLNQSELVLSNLLELANAKASDVGAKIDTEVQEPEELERRLLEAVGDKRRDEANEILRIGRLSWRLRDDDNLLVSRIESQLYRATEIGMERLLAASRIASKAELSEEAASIVASALKDRTQHSITFPSEATHPLSPVRNTSTSPRQLVGQPAAPGLATGVVRRIQGPDSFSKIRAGEILVCDAIQPMMTHLVPLAGAIIERRGGMLIHGAIIARELGIPCVNGIVNLMDLLTDGEFVTVDGHLGIVTVGAPEFDLELEMASN